MYNYGGTAEVVIHFKYQIFVCIRAVCAIFFSLKCDPTFNFALKEDFFQSAHETCENVEWLISQSERRKIGQSLTILACTITVRPIFIRNTSI
jgi:hypothetical protein